jgi:Fur family ferric uptake transcriptional regulator
MERMTRQRVSILAAIGAASRPLLPQEVLEAASATAPALSIATVYRTVKLFEEAGILERHEFQGGRSRYETVADGHHDHLIDIDTGDVIEFHDPELEDLQRRIAEKLGYRLVDHRMELYGQALKKPA